MIVLIFYTCHDGTVLCDCLIMIWNRTIWNLRPFVGVWVIFMFSHKRFKYEDFINTWHRYQCICRYIAICVYQYFMIASQYARILYCDVWCNLQMNLRMMWIKVVYSFIKWTMTLLWKDVQCEKGRHVWHAE